MKKLIVRKKHSDSESCDTTQEYTTQQETEDEIEDATEDEIEDVTEGNEERLIGGNQNQKPKTKQFKRYIDVAKKPPKGGTPQDNLTKPEILDQLDGYVPLRTIKEMEVLTKLPRYKTWVKYMNRKTGKYRVGGLLLKVVYPTYIMLVSPAQSFMWSVQLKDNVLFIRPPEDLLREEEERIQKEQIKEKLYEMYINGQLKKVD